MAKPLNSGVSWFFHCRFRSCPFFLSFILPVLPLANPYFRCRRLIPFSSLFLDEYYNWSSAMNVWNSLSFFFPTHCRAQLLHSKHVPSIFFQQTDSLPTSKLLPAFSTFSLFFQPFSLYWFSIIFPAISFQPFPSPTTRTYVCILSFVLNYHGRKCCFLPPFLHRLLAGCLFKRNLWG